MITRKKIAWGVMALAAVLGACGTQADKKKMNAKETAPPASETGKSDTANQPQAPAANPDAASKYDFVIINAIGDENKNQAAAMKTALTALVTDLGKKYQGQDAKFALIASTTAAISGVSLSLDPSAGFTSANSLQLNFEMAPRDAFLGTMVAGCGVNDSNLDSTHASGDIKVCNQMVSVPAHSWTWGVEDLKGKLQAFLRPGAKRRYIIIASNDVAVGSAQQFISITSAQNGGVAAQVNAFIPTKVEGICNDKNKPATVLEQAAKLSAGKTYSYCQVASWSSFSSDLLQSLN